VTHHDWSPGSWQSRSALQQPVYAEGSALAQALEQLSALPPLVTSWEVAALKSQLAEAAQGKRFLLQGGDCAERFDDCRAEQITNKLKILLQMSLVLIQGSKKPVIRVGRFAGQYAKPRSEDMETRDGVTLPTYRGDLVNGPEFTLADRTPDPQRLLRGYARSASTLNFIRALVRGGFADLHHPENWDLGFVDHSPLAEEYRHILAHVEDALRFMENILSVRVGEIDWVDFFTSHEALHLGYEMAQTRHVPRRAGWFNLAAHFPWIGARTADPDGAHVEYFRGIENPIAVKIGPPMTPEALKRLLDILHPKNEPGRMTLIHRLGAERVEKLLPPLIRTARECGKDVLWCCDPMHGNTRVTAEGIKTRDFGDILTELERAFDIHAYFGGRLGGVHIELSGENVTECVGGARGLTEQDLRRAYRSEVDPRLNYEQSLEIAMLIARKMASLNSAA
jgi:3-deoxy-7-phosphoheptulonate synthase